MIKSSALTVGALAIASPLVLLQTACGSTAQMVRWANAVIGALKDVSPILSTMPGTSAILSLVARAIPIAEKLKKALEDNDHASTLDFLDNLTNPQSGIIVEISNAVGGLQGSQKAIVLGVLATAQVFLRLIAANMAQAPADAIRAARTAKPRAAASVERASAGNALEAAFNASKF